MTPELPNLLHGAAAPVFLGPDAHGVGCRLGLLATYVLLGAVFWAIYRRERARYLAFWTAAFALLTIHDVFDVAVGWLASTGATILSFALLAATGLCAVAGAFEFVGRRVPRVRGLIALAALGAAAALSTLALPAAVSRTLLFTFIGATLLFAGLEILRRGPPGVGRYLAGGSLALYGLYEPFFPTLIATPGFERYEHFVDFAFILSVGLSILLMHFELARSEAERSTRRDRSLFDNAVVGLFRVGAERQVLAVNPALVEMLGYPDAEALMAVPAPDGFFVDRDAATALESRVLADGVVEALEVQLARSDGDVLDCVVDARIVSDAAGRPMYVEGMVRDVTAEKRVRAELEQARRLEALGRLAGGVAHDFNNILTTIVGAAELARETAPDGSMLRQDLGEILTGAERAADLTRQLLAFGRRQLVGRESVALGEIVRRTTRMAERVLRENVALVTAIEAEGAHVYAAPVEVEQVVMNLVLNAHDAMPDGGRMEVVVDRALAADGEAPRVRLRVRDTGEGMDAATRARMFEPFFSTKGPGRGSGLGLATVYGIVEQLGGHIEVDTAPGAGTTVCIALPESEAPASEAGGEPPEGSAASDAQAVRVLVVEDEEALRPFVARVFERAGFDVVGVAASGDAVLAAPPSPPPTLLVSDVVMPGISGFELARSLRARSPALRVLYISGYAADPAALQAGEAFLAKPFTPKELLAAASTLLEVPPA